MNINHIKSRIMKTETNSMRIVKPEKTDTAGTPQQE